MGNPLHKRLERIGKNTIRRKIVLALLDGPGLVYEIAIELDMTRQNACRHLLCLYKSGIVERTADLTGSHPRWIYRVADRYQNPTN